ncbi:MAG TPA: tRNA lysidine(34) synthetase TilS [Dehalococcoidia bacterium]|nr:tRNA lysidine(34) synthetase TilS [Dehalococcoidia bacterium]
MAGKITSSRFTRGVDREVLDDVRRRGHLLSGEAVVVGVSGGPDSTALLLIVSRIAKDLRLKLTAAHFDHQLRSRREADEDRRYVERLCKDLDLPLESGIGDVQSRARRHKESTEEAARIMRFRFLGSVADNVGASAVALGHTLDDQAETVLLHLVRGAGLGGLAAMSPRAAWPFGAGPDIARPLLERRREETVRYCRESGVEPRRDPTNNQPVATRNRLRAELLPPLRQFNPRIEEALARLAEAAAIDDEFINRVADRDWSALASATRDRVVFPREAFASFHPAVQARLLKRSVEKVGGDASVTSEHVAAVRAALEKRLTRVSLPGGLICTLSVGRVTISRGAEKAAPKQNAEAPPGRQVAQLQVPGKTDWGRWTIAAEKRTGRLPGRIGKMDAYLDVAKLRGQLVVRSRRPGDRMQPLGMRGGRKLQDILVDAKVPEAERDEVPVVADEKGIVWVAGHRLAERAAVSGDGPMVHLRAARKRRSAHR